MSFLTEITKRLRGAALKLFGLRSYEAGKIDRLSGDFKPAGLTADADAADSMYMVRGRARTMEQSDGFVKKYVGLVRANIPGPFGFRLQSRVMEYDPTTKTMVEDVLANSRIEDGWNDWSRRENCTVTGDMSFREFTHLMAAHYKRDGEFMARRVRFEGRYQFALQALEPDLLDENFSTRLPNGNRVVMGVEMNKWRRVVAFWLRKEDDGTNASMYSYSRQVERVPAEDIYFGYDRTRSFQTRGMSALSTSLMTLHNTREWEKASLVNARHSAGRLGFLSDSPDNQGAGPLPADETESDGTPVLKLEAGSMYDIGTKTFQGIDPKFPHEQHTPFVKSHLHRAAAGAEVSYYSLSNDYESTSFSSGRLSYTDERERWKMDQQYFVEALLEPIFRDWLEMALTSQAVKLPLSKFDKFFAPEFIGRTWNYLDPEKEAQADLLLDGAGLLSRKRWFAERGLDMETEVKQIATERKMYEQYGVEIVRSNAATARPAQDTPADPNTQAAAAKRAIENLLTHTNGNGHG